MSFWAGQLVQASMGVPPNRAVEEPHRDAEVLVKLAPEEIRLLPRNWPTVSGEQTTQAPVPWSRGVEAGLEVSRNIRILGKVAAAFSSGKLRARATVIPMFDWPEQSQTSPTQTSVTVIELVRPLTVKVSGFSPSARASMPTVQRPVSPALITRVWPASETATLLPRVGPAPDGHGLVLLEDHVIGEERRKLDLAARAAPAHPSAQPEDDSYELHKNSDARCRRAFNRPPAGLAAQELGHRLRPGADLEFLIDPADVGVDGFVADAQFFGDFLVKKPLAEAVENLLLAGGERLGGRGRLAGPLKGFGRPCGRCGSSWASRLGARRGWRPGVPRAGVRRLSMYPVAPAARALKMFSVSS